MIAIDLLATLSFCLCFLISVELFFINAFALQHYGAVCCYSCRAFFRRGITRSYVCVRGDDLCQVKVVLLFRAFAFVLNLILGEQHHSDQLQTMPVREMPGGGYEAGTSGCHSQA